MINHKLQNVEWDAPVHDLSLVALLKDSAKRKDFPTGNKLHADLLKGDSLARNVFIGSSLLNMYVKCSAIAKGQQVFDELSVRNVVSWNVLIVGYTQHGYDQEVLDCVEKMKCEGLSPDAVTFACILKACGNLGARDKGKEVHDEIARKGFLGKDIVLCTALVDMYAKFGALENAQQVFDELTARDVVCWTALIKGYCQHGCGEKAIYSFEQMRRDGVSPNADTYACILKACGNIGAVEKGKALHDEICNKKLLGKDIALGNALVDMYAKCGLMSRSHEVFDEFQVQTVVSWTALIGGYFQKGLPEEALICYEKMQGEGLSPDIVTFTHILQSCGSIGVIEKGKRIHAEIVKEGLLQKEIVLGNALLDMYVKCGALSNVRQLFDELPDQDVVSWNALIAGYVEREHGEEALKCLDQMHSQGVSPNASTYACLLQACSIVGAVEQGKQIHTEICMKAFLSDNIVLGNALISMYAKCSELFETQKVFDGLRVRDVVSWNGLMGGYAEAGKHNIVFYSFDKMRREGIKPSEITFTIVLNVCSHFGLLEKGQMYFQTMSTSCGIIPSPEHQTCMVDLLGRAGCFDNAIGMIEKMPSYNSLRAWYTLLAACEKWGKVELGKLAFRCVLQLDAKYAMAYVSMGNIYIAAGMQEDADKTLARAVQVLEELSSKDVVSWNALITGYGQLGHGKEALACLGRMTRDGLLPNVATFICILQACGIIGAAEKGQQIHKKVVEKGLLGINGPLETALVDMYAKCGALWKAQELFDNLPLRDVVSWTALIAGYCQHGHGEKALCCVELMEREGLSPDAVTYTCILKACGTLGSAEKGQMYFEAMSASDGIVPTCEHQTCLVDLFGRAGYFGKAMAMVKKMPSSYHIPGWFAVLGASRKMGCMKLGRLAFEHVVRPNERSVSVG